MLLRMVAVDLIDIRSDPGAGQEGASLPLRADRSL